MKWVIIEDKYLDFLRNTGDNRIPYSNYGTDKYKPFFGELFTIGDYSYITQVSSFKPKHQKMKEDKDFYKINRGKKTIAVINLNYMFPILTSKLIYLNNYNEISNFRLFKDKQEEKSYIALLRYELKIINKKPLTISAKYLYKNKYERPNSKLASRCIDFKQIEKVCDTYFINQKIKNQQTYTNSQNDTNNTTLKQ